MTQDQIEFVRRHGITRCPPGPQFGMTWGGRGRKGLRLRERSEADVIADLSSLPVRLSLRERFAVAAMKGESGE